MTKLKWNRTPGGWYVSLGPKRDYQVRRTPYGKTRFVYEAFWAPAGGQNYVAVPCSFSGTAKVAKQFAQDHSDSANLKFAREVKA